MNALFGDTPRAREALSERSGRDHGERVAVIPLAGVGWRREMRGTLRGGLNGFEVVRAVVGIQVEIRGEVIFAFFDAGIGRFWFLLFGEPAFWSG